MRGFLIVGVTRMTTADKINAKTNDSMSIPDHVAIIMDGNGRWALNRHLPRSEGHRKGVETIRVVLQAAADLGIKVITLYAFSTENWKRPPDEVAFLMNLLVEYLKREVKELHHQNIRICMIGVLEPFPRAVRNEIENAIELTRNNTGLVMNIALNYGARDEIMRAVQRKIHKDPHWLSTPQKIAEDEFAGYLDTAEFSDPDLIIRTGGEQRLSNFLLWQAAYAELYFTQVLWPDFGKADLLRAIEEYQARNRRFGGL